MLDDPTGAQAGFPVGLDHLVDTFGIGKGKVRQGELNHLGNVGPPDAPLEQRVHGHLVGPIQGGWRRPTGATGVVSR